MPSGREKTGLWLVGASGAVASTVAVGVVALRKGLCNAAGLVSALPPFKKVKLAEPGSLVIGGHEVRSETMLDTLRRLQTNSNLFSDELLRTCAPTLRAFQKNVRAGTLCGARAGIDRLLGVTSARDKRSPAATIARLTADIVTFKRSHHLDCVVVVYLASSEPHPTRAASINTQAKLERALNARGTSVLPPSSLYALAAIDAECPFVNFTPCLGIGVPAIRGRADEKGLCYMGNDGKTGETLVKSVLAPLFAMRNLPVMSWVGQNILGNQDGKVLDHPQTRRAKIKSKDKTIGRIIDGSPTTHVSIDYVPSLDDWKVAWDFIHFRGFLDTKMSMQFTWQGSDSVLAAPLVIDLARFTAREHRAGRSGPMRHLACFFKDPIDVRDHDYPTQWAMLLDHFQAPKKAPAEFRKRNR